MQRLTLIKVTDNYDMAHLYEHIFCNDFERLCIKNGLVNYLEYHYEANTYRGNFVHVDVRLLTPEAEKLATSIHNLDPSFSEENVTRAIMEISAEKLAKQVGELSKIQGALQEIQQLPWINIKDLEVIDYRKLRRTTKTLQFKEVSPNNFRKLKIVVALTRDVTQLPLAVEEALFYILGEAVINNLTIMLARDHSYYGSGAEWLFEARKVHCTKSYHVHKSVTMSLPELTDACRDTLTQAISFEFLAKAVRHIGGVDYDTSFGAPSELRMYEETGLLIGGTAWKALATGDNIRRVLKAMTITFSVSKESSCIELSELLGTL